VAFTDNQYAAARPTLCHLTHQENLHLIRQAGRSLPSVLLDPDSVGIISRGRRVTGGKPVLRDQDLLHPACVELTGGGWSMDDFLRDLSSRVFFWSGWPDRPVEHGRNAACRHTTTDVIIRVPFADVAVAGTSQFDRCNSGATRMQHGQRVLRGPSTFQPAAECMYGATQVVEVTFMGAVEMPSSADVGRPLEGSWEPLSNRTVAVPAAPAGGRGARLGAGRPGDGGVGVGERGRGGR